MLNTNVLNSKPLNAPGIVKVTVEATTLTARSKIETALNRRRRSSADMVVYYTTAAKPVLRTDVQSNLICLVDVDAAIDILKSIKSNIQSTAKLNVNVNTTAAIKGDFKYRSTILADTKHNANIKAELQTRSNLYARILNAIYNTSTLTTCSSIDVDTVLNRLLKSTITATAGLNLKALHISYLSNEIKTDSSLEVLPLKRVSISTSLNVKTIQIVGTEKHAHIKSALTTVFNTRSSPYIQAEISGKCSMASNLGADISRIRWESDYPFTGMWTREYPDNNTWRER